MRCAAGAGSALDAGSQRNARAQPRLELIPAPDLRRPAMPERLGPDGSTVRKPPGRQRARMRPRIGPIPAGRVLLGKAYEPVVPREGSTGSLAAPYQLAAARRSAAPAQERETVVETGGFRGFPRPRPRQCPTTNEAPRLFVATARIRRICSSRHAGARRTAYLDALSSRPRTPLLRAGSRSTATASSRPRHMSLTPKDGFPARFGADDKSGRRVDGRRTRLDRIITSVQERRREFKITLLNGPTRTDQGHGEESCRCARISDLQVGCSRSRPRRPTRPRDRRGVLAGRRCRGPRSPRSRSPGVALAGRQYRSVRAAEVLTIRRRAPGSQVGR